MLASRWSPAHQRMLQRLCTCLCREFEAAEQPPGGRRGKCDGGEARPQPGHDGGRDLTHGTGGAQGRRHRRVGAVQQPGRRQRGNDMCGCHCRRGVMPGVPVPLGHRRVAGVAAAVRPGVVHATRPGQPGVQRTLRHECAHEDRGQAKTAAGERPEGGELRDREGGHEPPRHRAFGDRVMPEGREHAADESEHPRAHARSRPDRLRARGPALARGHVIIRHGRPSSSTRSTPVRPRPGSPRRAGPVCGWRGRRTGSGRRGR